MGRTSARLSTVLPPTVRTASAKASHVGQRCMIAAAQLGRSGAGRAWCESAVAWSRTLSAKLFLSVIVFAPILRLRLTRIYPQGVCSGIDQRVEICCRDVVAPAFSFFPLALRVSEKTSSRQLVNRD